MIRLVRKLASVALMTAVLASPSIAQETSPPPGEEIVVTGKRLEPGVEQRVVRIKDLDLATYEGVKEMEKRVAAAVDAICSVPAVIGYYSQKVEKPCRDEGWASARPQMDRAVEKARANSPM